MKKRIEQLVVMAVAFVLCFAMALVITSCSSGSQASSTESGETRTFTDSLGREVEVPVNIERVAPSGNTANQVLLTMAPEKMVGIGEKFYESQEKYFADYIDLPVFGTVFGSKGDMNKEALMTANPQIIIDTGEAMDGLTQDLDALQEQLGIPVVFIETKLEDYATAYTMLGDLLNMPERGKELADYCSTAYAEVSDVMATIPESERVNMLYLMGDAGVNVIAKGSFQGQVVDMCANNVAVVETVKGGGMGQEVSFEQIAIWNPDLIVFGENGVYDTLADNTTWSVISAVQNNNCYEVPLGNPFNWLGNPPTVNQVMGMQWLPRLLYPDKFDTSIEDVTKSYYKTFYQYDLSEEELADLLKDASPKTK